MAAELTEVKTRKEAQKQTDQTKACMRMRKDRMKGQDLMKKWKHGETTTGNK